MNLKLYASITLFFLVVIFTLQNAEIVQINFLFWGFSISRALMIFLLLAIGMLIGGFTASHFIKSRNDRHR